MKDKFAFSGLVKIIYLRGENCLQDAHFYKQKWSCLKTPLNWTRSLFPLLRKPERGHILGNVSETPTPTTCLKSTAVHLQFVRQYAPHLYRRTFLASKLRRKGNPAIRLPFALQYASHLYGSTPPICMAVLLEKILGVGVTGTFLTFAKTTLLRNRPFGSQ